MAYPVGGYSPSAWSFSATPAGVPSTIAANGSYVSAPIAVSGYNAIAVSAQLSQTGSISVQRYIDAAGTIPVGAAITVALTANILASVDVNDGVPWAAFIVTISNSAGAIGNLSNVAILASATAA